VNNNSERLVVLSIPDIWLVGGYAVERYVDEALVPDAAALMNIYQHVQCNSGKVSAVSAIFGHSKTLLQIF
jgi:hypothetical protein